LTSAANAGTNCAAMTVNSKTEYWGNSYGYDPWGNLTQKAVTKCSAENLSLTALVNNQLSGYSYDAAGNMTSDPTDGVTNSYDAENRIATATKSGVSTSYVYDADGNRVEKTGGGTSTLYWYMSPGIIGESDSTGTMKSEYVFFNGARVARRDYPSGSVAYYFSDHLKTASVITDSAGNIKSESDYYPWGGELQFVNNDPNHFKFTGKERDGTGFDYFGARYYSNGLGRFITPDWDAKAAAVPYAEFADPQSLNLYAYVRNIPTARLDVDGHFMGALSNEGFEGFESFWDDMDRGDGIFALNAQKEAQQQSHQQTPAQTQESSLKKTGFWGRLREHLHNLLGGHSWNYGMRESVTIRITPAPDVEREPNPYVAAGTDALGLIGEATGHSSLGSLGAVISVANDHSAQNVIMTGMGFVPVIGEAAAAVSAVEDVGYLAAQKFVDKVLTPMFNAAPPQNIEDGNGHLIPNPGLMDDCQGLDGCN
jgi:RHS repeat-associated protein